MKVTSLIRNIISANKEITGYGIFKILEHKTKHSHQQIYRELKILNRNGDVSYRDVPQTGKPDRKAYRLKGTQRCSEPVKMTNFRKCSMAYKILDNDLKHGANNFDLYVETMEKAEHQLAELIGIT